MKNTKEKPKLTPEEQKDFNKRLLSGLNEAKDSNGSVLNLAMIMLKHLSPYVESVKMTSNKKVKIGEKK